MLVDNEWKWAKPRDAALRLGVATVPDRAQLGRLVNEAFDRILRQETCRGRASVIKPNLGFPTDEKGGTTSLALLEAVLAKIRRDYAPERVYVVESDGIAFRCEEVFDFLKLDDLCMRYDASLVNLSRLPRTPTRFADCRVLRSLALPSLLVDNEPLLINLAKIKTHEVSRFSGAIKNLYGLNPCVFKVEYHPRINDVLSDMYQIFRPDLNLVDGLWAVNGHGPWTGEAVKLDVLIASSDALAADLAALRVIGWNSQDVPYLHRLANTAPRVRTEVESLNPPALAGFEWVPVERASILKEWLARLAVPLLKRGMPLVFMSEGRLKIAVYGPRGQYCRSIVTWQGFGKSQRKEGKGR